MTACHNAWHFDMMELEAGKETPTFYCLLPKSLYRQFLASELLIVSF